jgi:hypothetical protein
VGGDQLALTWNCQMDEAVTLSALQAGVDALMGDGTARTTTADNVSYVIEVLPGRAFALPEQATLSIGTVATDLDIVNEGDDEAADGRVVINGTFDLVFDDIPVDDVTVTYVPGSTDGLTGVFSANAPFRSGTWFLSSLSTALSRTNVEVPVVFSDFE